MREIKKFVPRRRRANLVWVAIEYDYTVYDFAPIHKGDLPAMMDEYRIIDEEEQAGQAGQGREKFSFEVEECGIKVIYDGIVYKGVTYNLLVAKKIIDLSK